MKYIETYIVENGKQKKTREKVYDIEELPDLNVRFPVVYKRKRNRTICYINAACAFDIETTSIAAGQGKDTYYEGFMYHWQFCIDDMVIMGREWKKFKKLLAYLYEHLDLNENKRLVIYVHNLGFEFQFLKDIIGVDELFARDKRKPLYFVRNGFEFRCSYFLSNMSLAKFCENSALARHYKLDVDMFDYRKIRTNRTPLEPYEIGYCYNDVRGLCECINTLLLEDTIATIPLTSTGYVRRDFRNACRKFRGYREKLDKQLIDTVELYRLAKRAFRGGNTHASRFYAGQIIRNVKSRDGASAYPAQMNAAYFPIGKFTKFTIDKYDEFLEYLNEYCCLFTMDFYGIVIKEGIPIPYIDIAHCTMHNSILNDNGRVLQAEYIQYSMTEIDFKIIESQYEWESCELTVFYFTERGYLPEPIRTTSMDYFRKKTTLKGVEGKEYEYMKSKNKLNSGFGMMVTDIVSDDVCVKENEGGTLEWEKKPVSDERMEELIERYSQSKNTFLNYMWGIWVTAQQRHTLQQGIDICGMNTVYVDTDSVKYFSTPEIERRFEELNKELKHKQEIAPLKGIINHKGREICLGVFESDGDYKRFLTFGAKKYCYENQDGSFHITVAGMGKKKGAERVGCIENFQIGRTYKDVGRSVLFYNDSKPHEMTVTDCNGVTSTFMTASNIGVVDTTYTLGVTDEYYELILKERIDINGKLI